MATFLLDLDGVIYKHSTIDFNEGAVNYLKRIKDEGHSLVFKTAQKSSITIFHLCILTLQLRNCITQGLNLIQLSEIFQVRGSWPMMTEILL